ncbi:UNVERIFIED_CONTAM: Glyoxylate/hydroxypyruvate reductase HPR3 [Sesamum radiatum]|uniref:Glyoxylate/hydroxypyruvate reductase HPR3 n=1 Tax=Sesamum radiatum TaxID=300843 RepID=A0AAW2MH18_SESRA
MAAAADQHQRPQPLPLLLLHRFASFNLSFLPVLRTKYTVLDPFADPPDPSFPTLSKSARVMLCVGPKPVTSEDLDRYPSLEYILGTSAGINNFDLAACRRRVIRLTSAGDVFSVDVADYAVGLAIDVLRRVSAADRFVRAGSWPVQNEYTLGSKVSGKRVGIVGLGSIGSRVAKRFEAFGAALPTTQGSKSLTSALGKTGVIVNVGRGPLIDEKELVELLVRGEIGGAGLDVFENEPHVPEPLFGLDNVVLSPHKAVLTLDSFAALEELIFSNLEAFFSNQPLRAEVELD